MIDLNIVENSFNKNERNTFHSRIKYNNYFILQWIWYFDYNLIDINY